jgi:hypothetical protein
LRFHGAGPGRAQAAGGIQGRRVHQVGMVVVWAQVLQPLSLRSGWCVLKSGAITAVPTSVATHDQVLARLI